MKATTSRIRPDVGFPYSWERPRILSLRLDRIATTGQPLTASSSRTGGPFGVAPAIVILTSRAAVGAKWKVSVVPAVGPETMATGLH